jgi:2-oxoisovalerate dehydrogenase E1 component
MRKKGIVSIDLFKQIASFSLNAQIDSISAENIEEALRIRLVEEKFLELFSQGKMNGTVHTCVGQEFSAVAVAGQLTEDDWVTSNHRCHGHFISKTKNWQGLIDELMGLESGVCKGLGSSQHLYASGFLSNGPQAALVPVATGIALHKKIHNQSGIAVSYIGEGTLGEGALYEAFNLASLYQAPHLIVCENNLYSQSTPQLTGVSGSILARPEAFGIKTFEADTWNIETLIKVSREAINYVRNGSPAFLMIRTYRLNAHSKGDDDRDKDEVQFFKDNDPIGQLLEIEKWAKLAQKISLQINDHIVKASPNVLSFDNYVKDQLPRKTTAKFEPVVNEKKRMIQALNGAYRETLEAGAFHIGEDICDPYGGAFKVTKGLSTDFPKMVRNSSISEDGLLGVAIGIALMGTHSFAEIMFGDFMTHTFDQLISNASKIHHMYAFQASVPVRIRTPMGGKRGYGPTHSQSLEKHFLGIDNVGVISLSSLMDPAIAISESKEVDFPLVILENKVDYGKMLWSGSEDFELNRESKIFGSLRLSPKMAAPSLTIVSYGETARHIADHLERFFEETDFVPELICLTQLHPLDSNLIERSVKKTGQLLTVEDGSIDFGLGAEIFSKLTEKGQSFQFALRVGAEPVPVPSITQLELEVLPTIDRIISLVKTKKSMHRVQS